MSVLNSSLESRGSVRARFRPCPNENNHAKAHVWNITFKNRKIQDGFLNIVTVDFENDEKEKSHKTNKGRARNINWDPKICERVDDYRSSNKKFFRSYEEDDGNSKKNSSGSDKEDNGRIVKNTSGSVKEDDERNVKNTSGSVKEDERNVKNTSGSVKEDDERNVKNTSGSVKEDGSCGSGKEDGGSSERNTSGSDEEDNGCRSDKEEDGNCEKNTSGIDKEDNGSVEKKICGENKEVTEGTAKEDLDFGGEEGKAMKNNTKNEKGKADDQEKDPPGNGNKRTDKDMGIRITINFGAWAKVTFLWVLCCFVASASSVTVDPPGQPLPPECIAEMDARQGECPKDFDLETDHAHLNSLCCVRFENQVFHCMMGYDPNGNQFSRFSCVRPVNISENHLVRFKHYHTENPSLEVYLSDHPEYREGSERQSWEVIYFYPTEEKSECDGFGQDFLCYEGGDRMCTCSPGYQPSSQTCLPWFRDQDPCFCVPLNCPSGSFPSRNFSLQNKACMNLRDGGFSPGFMCESLPTTVEPSTRSTWETIPSSGGVTSTASVPRHTEEDGITGTTSTEGWSVLSACLVILGSFVVIVVCVVVVVIWNLNNRVHPMNYNQLDPLVQIV